MVHPPRHNTVTPRPRHTEPTPVRILLVSDLHMGSGSGSDVLRVPALRAALLDAVADVERLVLLGDMLDKSPAAEPALAELWRPILAQYGPGLVVRSERAIEMADEIALASLISGMFAGGPDAEARAQTVVKALGSFATTKAHGRHLERGTARTLGLEIVDLESDAALEEAVLSLHYACVLSFQQAGVLKIIENHLGESYPLTA